MCGIAGYYDENIESEERRHVAQALADSLAIRGPDSFGEWGDEDSGMALAHRRLAILDLSPAGHQPMISASQRHVLVYNGEIYNYQEIAKELEAHGITLKGGSDTEVLLEAIDLWGVRATLERANGMFAFALWDRKERELTLARDRLGIKPLYYGWNNGRFLFGSELKAFRAHPQFEYHIHRDALALFCRHNYIPAPHSIYDGIYKLLPASFLTLSSEQLRMKPNDFTPFANDKEVSPATYWNYRDVVDDEILHDEQEYLSELEDLLKSSIQYRMISDVPLGSFLSGGIDSSLVVSLMQQLGTGSVKTFSIGFEEKGYNEADHAQRIAQHLGTDHTELYVTPQDAIAVIPKLSSMYDEPFADSSQVPTYLVSQLARRDVTVSLSGDGGDELFAGYPRYLWTDTIWRNIASVPQPFRSVASRLLRILSPNAWTWWIDSLSPILPSSLQSFKEPGEKIHRLSDVLSAGSMGSLYTKVNTHWPGVGKPVLGAKEIDSCITEDWLPDKDPYKLFSGIDLVSYLPDDILVKLDRASMACSLEARVPLLDHRVVEFAMKTPSSMKIRDGQQKWPLRELLKRHVPVELFDRPKTGFGIPIGQWLRGPLKEWASDLLSSQSLQRHDYFKNDLIQATWSEHCSGKRSHQYLLWDILMFQDWLRSH